MLVKCGDSPKSGPSLDGNFWRDKNKKIFHCEFLEKEF